MKAKRVLGDGSDVQVLLDAAGERREVFMAGNRLTRTEFLCGRLETAQSNTHAYLPLERVLLLAIRDRGDGILIDGAHKQRWR